MMADRQDQLESHLATVEARLARLDQLSERQQRRTVWQEERDALQASRRVVKSDLRQKFREMDGNQRDIRTLENLSRWQKGTARWQTRRDHLDVRQENGRRATAILMNRLDQLDDRLRDHHLVPRAERAEKAHVRERERLEDERSRLRGGMQAMDQRPSRQRDAPPARSQDELSRLRGRVDETRRAYEDADRAARREAKRQEILDRLHKDRQGRPDRSR